MDVTCSEPNSNAETDRYPLLMEQMESHNDRQHIIDMTRNNGASSSASHDGQRPEMDIPQYDDRPSSNTQDLTHQTSSSSSNILNSRNSTFTRRSDSYSHRHRSPLNSGLWISVELLVTVGQIIASIVVLLMSRNENPQTPLFAWVLGYASGCVATLPFLYWRFRNRNQSAQQDSVQYHQGASQSTAPESTSYRAISISQTSDEENLRTTESATVNSQIAGRLRVRLNGYALMDHFKLVLDCFFAVWFVVGNVWIFGGHSTPTDAPKLYKLCIVFLTFSCIGYAMPFILCATICCCLPCIISLLGFREDFSQTRGASTEFINTLPIYKFKLKNTGNVDDHDNSRDTEEGVLAAGTEKERVISGEDAVCCICLNKYVDNDELRELPCSHVFHVDCVDKWLKINASCPLCKSEVCETSDTSQSARGSSQH